MPVVGLRIRQCGAWVAFLLLIGPGSALAEYQKFRSFTGADGLSQLGVTSIAQDEQGHLWVGTRWFWELRMGCGDADIHALAAAAGGYVGTATGLDLVKDGKVQDFGTSYGLRVGTAKFLVTDTEGGIWVAGTKGVFVLDRATDSFQRRLEGEVSALKGRFTSGIRVDSKSSKALRSSTVFIVVTMYS